MAINVTTVARTLAAHMTRAERQGAHGDYCSLRDACIEIACEAATFEGALRFIRLCGLSDSLRTFDRDKLEATWAVIHRS